MGAVVPRPGERALPAASGLLLAASFPPLHLLVPPFVALVPFAVWVARLPGDRHGEGAAARGGLVVGLVSHGLLLHWLVPALAWVTAWAPLAYLLIVGVLSALTLMGGWTLHRMVHRARVPLWLAVPVAWTAVDWLQGHLPGPLAFPWLGLGTALTAVPEVVGTAEWVGARGMGFWVAAVSGWLATGFVRGYGRLRVAGVTAVLVLVPAVSGLALTRAVDTRAVARVAFVVTDIPAAVRQEGAAAWNARAEAVLDTVQAHLDGEAVDLVVLPEGMLMSTGGSDVLPRLGVPVLLGVYARAGDGPPRNLAVLADGRGEELATYEKRRLVPLVEWRPGASTPSGSGSAAATPPVLSHGAGHAYGPLICFEAIFPGAARSARRAGADMLVNVTNDAWFGAGSGLGGVGRAQHAAHLVMRAVEHRVGAVRSANGGYAYVVEPTGHVRRVLRPGDGTWVADDDVRSAPGPTVYTRLGDLAGAGSVLAGLLFLLMGRGGGGPAGPRPSLDPQRLSR